jgi:hypothetical protein
MRVHWHVTINPALALVMLAAAAASALADDPCRSRICRDGYHYRHGRCESEPAPITLAREHYQVSHPVCQAGWQVDGDYCEKVDCCWRPACKSDERYRDGYCHSGPTFFGWRMHHRATCPAGWDLQVSSGWCHKQGCGGQPPPPARAAGPGDTPLPRDDDPPPPARAAGPGDARPAGPGDPPPPVVRAVRIDDILPNSCVDIGGVVRVRGARFGAARGDRQLVLGGHGISVFLRVTSWSNTLITAIIPNDPRIQRGQWYYIGIQNAATHWLSNIDETFTVCSQLE